MLGRSCAVPRDRYPTACNLTDTLTHACCVGPNAGVKHVPGLIRRCVLGQLKAPGCLSGVRARQGKVPFATCEDEETLEEEVRRLLGKPWHQSLSNLRQARTLRMQCSSRHADERPCDAPK